MDGVRRISGLCFGILGITFIVMAFFEMFSGGGGLAAWLYGPAEDEDGFPVQARPVVYLMPTDHSD